MEFFVDSMTNSTEGQEMFNYFYNQPTELTDPSEIEDFAWSSVEHYYTHMFYTMHHKHYFEPAVDCRVPEQCYNRYFDESEPQDDYLAGYRLYTGRFFSGACMHDHDGLMNLPLPENSLPDGPGFDFDLNPFNNPSTGGTGNAHNAGVNFDRIEMFVPNSGVDDFIPFINENPPSGNRSIRLNNQRTGSHASTMERTFIVEAGATELTFYAAIVLEDPAGHPQNVKPYFKALLIDCEDEVVDEICLVSGTTDNHLESGIFSGRQMSYADWKCYIFDISSYDCQILTLRFITASCGWTGHFGYSYIADICEPCS